MSWHTYEDPELKRSSESQGGKGQDGPDRHPTVIYVCDVYDPVVNTRIMVMNAASPLTAIPTKTNPFHLNITRLNKARPLLPRLSHV
jgi:hypothetical protein